VIRRLRLFASSVAHTRPRQLAARLRLMARRRAMQRVARLVPPRGSVPAAQVPPLREPSPPPMFAPRRHLVVGAPGAPRLRVLNREFALTVPVRWRPPELDRGTGLEKLNLHYMEFLESVDDAAFQALVDDWITANPPYQPGYWRDAWSSYSLSIRCVVWMQQIAARRPRLDPAMVARACASLVAQLRFLERNLEMDVGGNHLLKNLKALFWAGRFFAGDEAARWRGLGERLLPAELDEQVLGDGVHYERSPAYHAQAFADLLECRQVMEPGAPRDGLDAALGRMAQALADLSHPDGCPSLFNDGGLHMTYAPAECLDVHARLLGTPAARPRALFAASDAGYYGARAGGDLVVVDCGAISPDFLPAHGHGDILSFEWSVAGMRIVVDAGVYEYHAGEARDYSRSTRAHNTVTVDDGDQAEFYSAFRIGRRPHPVVHRYQARDGGFVLEGSHDGYRRLAGAPVHRRTFDASPARIGVRDEVRGGAGQAVAARLLLHPECTVDAVPGGAVIRRGGVEVALTSEARVTVAEARWFPDFGVEARTLQVTLHYGAAPCAGGFVLAVRGRPGRADGPAASPAEDAR
jgi:uncharacterized heparinase superfamily protein